MAKVLWILTRKPDVLAHELPVAPFPDKDLESVAIEAVNQACCEVGGGLPLCVREQPGYPGSVASLRKCHLKLMSLHGIDPIMFHFFCEGTRQSTFSLCRDAFCIFEDSRI